ncbi:MAG: peptide-methionine (R)-S-oxide reductase [Parcubacteria bacterium C7867-003]|nr:MAG: peptide-methionine (R)-S-oxide reductase [Parcubacteria bacterium C7867-003]
MEINEQELKEKLTPEEYTVLREKGTEAPFSGKLLHDDRDGMYKCKVCGQDLFSSDAKFDSGTGWPSFDQAVPGSVVETEDNTHGMIRTEITCSKCGSHLGPLLPEFRLFGVKLPNLAICSFRNLKYSSPY